MSQEATAAIIVSGLVAKEGARVAADLIKDVAGPSAKALGEALAVPLQTWRDVRVLRAQQVVQEAATMAARSKLPVHAVPPRMLIPIIEEASLEDEPELVRMWSALLANTATLSKLVLPSFPKILAELSPTEVRMLDTLKAGRYKMKDLTELEGRVDMLQRHAGTNEELQLAVINLERLQLVRPELGHNPFHRVPENMFLQSNIALTHFGARFVLACTPPA